MRKCNCASTVFLCAMLLVGKVAYAQFPVFDVSEFAPIMKDVKSGIDTVKDLKEQLNLKDKTLNAIGREASSLSKFKKGHKKSKDSTKKTTDEANQTLNNGKKTTETTLNNASESTTETITKQTEIIDDYIDQTEELSTGKISSPRKQKNTAPRSFKYLYTDGDEPSATNPIQPKQNFVLKENDVVEEEEEEEEIDVETIQNEVKFLQAEVLKEQKRLFVELNDILDTQLTLLNQTATNNMNVLAKLNASIQETTKISAMDKQKIQEQIAQISKEQRETDDWAIRIVESIKENYNKEYNNTIKDGINNYTKVVEAYLKGDVEKNKVIVAGNTLKNQVAKINVAPDRSVLNSLYKKSTDITDEVEKLTYKINKILDNTSKT